MNEYVDHFHRQVVAPLECVIGRQLIDVYYWVLSVDAPTFNIDAPNQSGSVRVVVLQFDDAVLEVDLGVERELTNSDAFENIHLIVRADAEVIDRTAAEQLGFGGWTYVQASTGLHWSKTLHKKLEHVSVFGDNLRPVAISFEFQQATIMIAVGDGQWSPTVIGDGDDLLLFSGDEWKIADRSISIKVIWHST